MTSTGDQPRAGEPRADQRPADETRAEPDRPLSGPPEPWAETDMPSLRDGPPWHMTEMIEAEPALAERLLTRLADPASSAVDLAEQIRATAHRRAAIVITGCGTSEHGAMAAAEILREAMRGAGLPWRLGEGGAPVAAQAFEASLDDELGAGGLVIGISHEGGTWATNRALERARSSGAAIGLVTVSDRSPAGKLADVVVATEELDRSWCHTIGYLAPILAATAVGAHLSGRPVDPAAVRALLAAGLGADRTAAVERLAAALAPLDRIVVVGSGADRVAARELALKLEEGTHLPATARDLETLLHGHLAGMDAGTGLVLIAADEANVEARRARAAGALRAGQAIGCVVGAIAGRAYRDTIRAELVVGADVGAADSDLPTAAAALLATAVPLQLLTERIARIRGTNPDPIRRDDPAYLRAAEAPSASA
jgi:glutamine---fructose-6-phosphate transaminase (isomerizing)